MICIEIPPNANCDPMDLRIFHETDDPQPVVRVRLERQSGVASWYEIVGWKFDNAPGPARAQKVDDSGEGVAFLIYGTEAGLRLRVDGSQTPWSLTATDQWGEPLLIVSDPSDLQFAHERDLHG